MQLKIKKLHPDAVLPTYATPGAACFDLYASSIQRNDVFGTGIAVEVPPGYAMKVYSRSGHGFKYGARLANCVGIIDSDFRGEVMVKLAFDNDRLPLPTIRVGDRIAQAMIEPAPQVEFVEVDELSDTERGTGGFGSTGG